MKSISLLLFCAIAIAISKGEEEEIELNQYGCPTNFTIETFIPHEYCNKFYQCVNGEPVALKCPNGLVYNEKVHVCDWPLNVDCEERLISDSSSSEEDSSDKDHEHTVIVESDPSLAPFICAGENSDNYLIAHENCNQFYQCLQAEPIAIDCPQNLVFNTDHGFCDWPVNVNCSGRINPYEEDDSTPANAIEACARASYEGFTLPHEYCNWFYRCSNGAAIGFICPSGLLFSVDNKTCEWPMYVNCEDKPIVELEVEETTVEDTSESGSGSYGYADPSEAKDICSAEGSDGKLIAHENCDQYYMCWNRSPIALECSANLHYNPDQGICDWPQNVDCGERIVKE